MSVETKETTEEESGAESEGWRKSSGRREQPKRAESRERTAGHRNSRCKGPVSGSVIQPQNGNLGKQDHMKLERCEE